MKVYRHIRFEDRQKMQALFLEGGGPEKVAAELGFPAAAIYRELKRCADTGERNIAPKAYDPKTAQADADQKRIRKGTLHKPRNTVQQARRMLQRQAWQMKKACDECLDLLERDDSQ